MKPKVTSYLTLFVLPFILLSCDCLQRVQGYVVDAETKQPLAGVYFTNSLLTDEEKQAILNDSVNRYRPITDNTGWFSDGSIANGFNCKPRLTLWLEKEGYTPVQIEWHPRKSSQDTLVVKLKKQ